MGSKCCKPEDKIYSDVARINEQQQQYRPFSPYTLTPVPLINNHNDISIRKRKEENDQDDDYDDKEEKVGESSSSKRPIAAKRSGAVHRSSVRSSERTIMEVLPEFVKPLGEYAFKVNGKGKIFVTVQSHSEYKVTWFRNGKKLDPATDARYQYAIENDTHSLNLLQVHLEDEGRWTCVAENIVGKQTTHGVVKLMIPRAYKPPEFVEPLRAILTEAGTVSLECKVTGIPTPALQWFKDGEPIKPGDVFALKQADPTSLGSYTCQATNCMGTAVSCSHVHVTSSRPAIMDGLVDHKARIGEPHVLTVGVRNPVGKVIWYNKGVEVKEDSRIQMVQNDYSVELVLNPLMLCDDGEWKCSVNGVETNCFLSVVAPKNYRKPRFLQDLKAVLTEEGLVTFECKVVGYPTPELKWFKDGVELKPGDVYQLCGSNSLGLYTCIASNCMGVSESTAELTFDDIQFQLSDEERGKLLEHLSSVNRPPQFVRGLKSATVLVGSKLELTVELNCKAALEWYFENQLIQPGEDYTITGNSLISEALPIGKEGEYKCVAKNEYGTSFSCCRISLNVPSTYKKPRFLEGLRAVLHEGIVNLECKVIGVPQPTLKWFKDGVELKAGDIHKIVSSGGNCCLGTYTCQARNCMGTCESSASLLGFEETKKQEDILENFARDPSLSTILEERSSQMVSVYETAEGLDEISVSIDGKEVSVSLYETPDLTEQDAKNIIEMFAEEYSEHISEHNVLTLPSLRFVKETTNSGRIVMEAVVIDVDVEGFETPPSRHDSGSEKTEADFEDITDLSESRHELLEDFEAVQVGAAVELVLEKEKTMTSLESPTDINTVVSSGLKMLEIPENDDFRIVDPDDSSSPEVSFYSEGLETPVFGSMEALPQKIEDDWEIVGNREITEGFNEAIDEFGGKINEFLNELNKLTGTETDQINIFDSNELEPLPEMILQEGQPELIVPDKETAMMESAKEQQKSERKDSMTQTAHTVKSMADNNKKSNLQQQDSNDGFEIIEHSDIVDESQKKSTEQQEAQKQNQTLSDNGSATTPVEKIKKGDDTGDKSKSATDASLVTQQISAAGTDDQSQAPAVQQTPKIADNDIFGTDNSASSIKTQQEQDTADGSKKPEQQSLVTRDDNSIDQLKPKQVNESEQQDNSKQAQEKQEKKPTSQTSQTVNIQQVTETSQATATAGDKVQNVATAQEVQQQTSVEAIETQQSVTSSAQAMQSVSTGQKQMATAVDVVTLEAAEINAVNEVTKAEAAQTVDRALSAAVSTETTSMTAEAKASVSTTAEAQTATMSADTLVTTDSQAKIVAAETMQKAASAEATTGAEGASEIKNLTETVQAQSAVTSSDTADRALQTQNADVRISKQEEIQKAEEQANKDATTKDAATKDEATKDAATKDVATKDAATKDAATKDAATKDAATKDAATKDAATKDAATKDAATKNAVTKDAKDGKAVAPENQAKLEKSVLADEATADLTSDVRNAASASAVQQLAVAATTEAQVTAETVNALENASTETKKTKVSVTGQASEKLTAQAASATVTEENEQASSVGQSTKVNAAESEATDENQLKKPERTQKRVQFAEAQNSSYETASEMSESSDTAAKAQKQQQQTATSEAVAGQVSITAENVSTLETQSPEALQGQVASELKSKTAASSDLVQSQESVGAISIEKDDMQKARTAETDMLKSATASEAATVLQSGKVSSAGVETQEAQLLVESSTAQQQVATAIGSEESKSASAVTATVPLEGVQTLSGAEVPSKQAAVVLQGTDGVAATKIQETLAESGITAASPEHAVEATADALIQAAITTEISASQGVGQVSSKPEETAQAVSTVNNANLQVGVVSEDTASASVATVNTSEAVQGLTAQVGETITATIPEGAVTEVEARSQATVSSQDGSSEQATGLTTTPGKTAQANAGLASGVPLEMVQALEAATADKIQADNSVQESNLQAATATTTTTKEAQKDESPNDVQKFATQEATASESVTAEAAKALATQGSGEGLTAATSSQVQLAGTTAETQPTEVAQAAPGLTDEKPKTAAVSATVKAQESTAEIKITETVNSKAADSLVEGNLVASVANVSIQESAAETADTATAKVEATVSGKEEMIRNAATASSVTPQTSVAENVSKEESKAKVAVSAEGQSVQNAATATTIAGQESVSLDANAETTKVQAAVAVEAQNAGVVAAVANVTIQGTSTEVQSIDTSANIRLTSGPSGEAAETLQTAAATVTGSSAAPTQVSSSESAALEIEKTEKAVAEETVDDKKLAKAAQGLQQSKVAAQDNQDETAQPLQGIQAVTGDNVEEIKQDQLASAVVKKVKKIVLESGDSISKKPQTLNEEGSEKQAVADREAALANASGSSGDNLAHDQLEVNAKTTTEQQVAAEKVEGDLPEKAISNTESGRTHETAAAGQERAQEQEETAKAAPREARDSSDSISTTEGVQVAEKAPAAEQPTSESKSQSGKEETKSADGVTASTGQSKAEESQKLAEGSSKTAENESKLPGDAEKVDKNDGVKSADKLKGTQIEKSTAEEASKGTEEVPKVPKSTKDTAEAVQQSNKVKSEENVKANLKDKEKHTQQAPSSASDVPEVEAGSKKISEDAKKSLDEKHDSTEKKEAKEPVDEALSTKSQKVEQLDKPSETAEESKQVPTAPPRRKSKAEKANKESGKSTEVETQDAAKEAINQAEVKAAGINVDKAKDAKNLEDISKSKKTESPEESNKTVAKQDDKAVAKSEGTNDNAVSNEKETSASKKVDAGVENKELAARDEEKQTENASLTKDKKQKASLNSEETLQKSDKTTSEQPKTGSSAKEMETESTTQEPNGQATKASNGTAAIQDGKSKDVADNLTEIKQTEQKQKITKKGDEQPELTAKQPSTVTETSIDAAEAEDTSLPDKNDSKRDRASKKRKSTDESKTDGPTQKAAEETQPAQDSKSQIQTATDSSSPETQQPHTPVSPSNTEAGSGVPSSSDTATGENIVVDKDGKKVINVNLTKIKQEPLASFDDVVADAAAIEPGSDTKKSEKTQKSGETVQDDKTKTSEDKKADQPEAGKKDTDLKKQEDENREGKQAKHETETKLEKKATTEQEKKLKEETETDKIPKAEAQEEKKNKEAERKKAEEDTKAKEEAEKKKAEEEQKAKQGADKKKGDEKRAEEEADVKKKKAKEDEENKKTNNEAEKDMKAKEEAEEKKSEESEAKKKLEEATEKKKTEDEKKAKDEVEKKKKTDNESKKKTAQEEKETEKTKTAEEKKSKEEVEKKRKIEEEKKAKEEAEKKAKEDAEKKRAEEEKQAQEAEKKKKDEEEKKAKEESDKKNAEAEKKSKEEADKKKKEEEEKKVNEEAEKKKAKAEAEKKKKAEEEKKAKEDAEKKKADEEKKAKEEAEKKKVEEEAAKNKKAEEEKKAKEEEEKKAKVEVEKKKKAEEEKKAKEEEEKKAKVEVEKKKKAEEEKKAKEEEEKKAKVEAEKKKKAIEEAEKKKTEEEKKAKEEAEKKKKAEEAEKKKAEEEAAKKKAAEEKKAKEEAEKKKKEEEAKAKEEAEKKKTEEEKKAKADAEKKKKEEEEKKAKAEAEKKKKEEEEKKAEAEKKKKEEEEKKAEAEKKKKEEEEKKAKVEAEKKKKAEEEKKAKEEAEKKKAAEEKKAKEEAEKKKKADEEKKAKEEAEKKAKDEEEKKLKGQNEKKKIQQEEKSKVEAAKKDGTVETKKKDEESDDKKSSTETEASAAGKKASDDSTKALAEEVPKKPKRLSSKKKKDATADNSTEEAKSSDGTISKSREGSVKKTKDGSVKKSTKKPTPDDATADQAQLKKQTEALTDTSATSLEATESILKAEGKHATECLASRAEEAAPLIRTTDVSSVEQTASSHADEELAGTRRRTRERRNEAASPPPTQSIDRVSTAMGDALPRQRQTDKYNTESDNPPYVPRRRKLDSAETEVSDFSNSSVSRRHLRCDESYEGDSVSERSRSPSSYKYDNFSATRDYSESKLGYSRRADTGISSASSVTSTSYNREHKDYMSAHSASSYRGLETHSSSSRRFNDDRATHSKWERPARLGQATTSAYSMRDLSVTDYSYKYRQPSRSPVPEESGNRAHIPKWDSKSVFGLEEARDYMKSLGYYSAIDEHDSSLAGVDDLPTDSSHHYNAISRRRPRFTIRLLDRVVSTGAILSINCSATGTPLPNLEWYRNGFPVVPDARVKIIGGVGFGSIEIRGVEKSDQAEYSCVAVNSFGRARTSATIHVFDLNYTAHKGTAPVLFYSQMITETRTSNEIVLETFVKGHEELSWYKDDVPLVGPNYHSQILGDGRCRLTIRNPRSSDSGSYRVTGRNHFSVNSLSKYISIDDFSITGFRLPVFIKGLSDLSVEIGDSLFLSVTVEGAETVEFYKNGRLRETKMNRIGCYSTFIPFVQVEDLGVYVAVARNRYGNVESCCMLRAIGGRASIMPSFVVKPKPVYIVDVGVDLNIVVQVEGEPTPFVNWYKGCKNMILENARAMRETLSPCSIRFTLKKLTVSDAGLYTLKAKNLIGEDVTQFYVQVRETRARSLTPVSSLNERRSSLASRNRHWASVERLARSYRNSALQSYSYSSLTTRDRGSTPRMIQENSVSVQEILPGWVSINWSRVRGRIAGYYVHCRDISDENSDWIQLAFTRVCSHEANLLPGRDYVFKITPKCKSMEDEFSMLSDPFFLSNRVIPEFTQLLPVSTVGFVGSVYTLKCQVREGVPCSIQWFKDGEPVDSNEGSNYRSSFKNQVAELEFTVGDGDSGRYCCEAKNTFGRTISYSHFQTTTTHQHVIPCNLENVEYPVILMEPKNRIVKNGCNAVVSCQVSPEKCNIEWIFNGEPIHDEDRNYKLTNNGKFYSLEINSVGAKLSGLYTFRASNSAGSCSSQFSIHCVEDEMDMKPRFLNQPTNLRVNPGEKFTLHGFVMGAGILFYTWKKDGRTIHRNRYKCYITEHEQNHASLTVVKPLVEHSGRYECTVYNSYGEDTIRFNVVVEPVQKTNASKNPASKLQFKRRPEPIEIIEGDSTILEFECAGDTGDDVQYKWYKDGLNVKDTKDAPHFTLENIGSIYRLIIQDAKMQFSGAYKLMVRSGPSSITGVTSVQVMCKSSSDPVIDIKCPAATKPVITKDMNKVQCNYKDRVELTVEFQSNSETFYIHWDVDGIVTTGKNYSSIVIPSVENSMPVSMRVFNSVGFASSQGYVSISDSSPAYGKRRIIPTAGKTMTNFAGRQLPRFYTHLHDKTVSVEDRKALLQVSIKCNNLTRTKWFKDNEELVNNSKYVVREDGDLQSLEILNLNLFDCGIYSVNIENRAGSNASSCYLHVS